MKSSALSKRAIAGRATLGRAGLGRALLFLGIAAGCSAVSAAQEYGETIVSTTANGVRMATVSFADLDVASPRGQEIMHARISQAARMVCGPGDFRRAGSLQQAKENRDCYHSALSGAMSQLSTDQVAAVTISE